MLVFAEPTPQLQPSGTLLSEPSSRFWNASFSAANSIGSPSFVPVPCAST